MGVALSKMSSLAMMEMEHIGELLKLRRAVPSDIVREFIDGFIREAYYRLRLVDALSHEVAIPEGETPEELRFDDVVRRLNDMCRHYEEHLALIREMRGRASSPMELELLAVIERSLERSHTTIRMLINAIDELRRR